MGCLIVDHLFGGRAVSRLCSRWSVRVDKPTRPCVTVIALRLRSRGKTSAFFLPVDGSPGDGVSNLFGDTDDLVSDSHCCARVRSRLSPSFLLLTALHVIAGVWLMSRTSDM